jgi:hypothetical protein
VREEREGEYQCARAGFRQLRESARGVRGQNARDPRMSGVREASSDSMDTRRTWNPSTAHERECYHSGLAGSRRKPGEEVSARLSSMGVATGTGANPSKP